MGNINATIGNSISYTGQVTITLNTLGHKRCIAVHNRGTKHLFDTLSRALAGYPIIGSTPKFIDIQHQASSDNYESALKAVIPFTGIVYGESAEATSEDGRILLNAIITDDDKQPITKLNNPKLVILDASKRILAEITAVSSIESLWASVTSATDAIIEWKLIFTN